MDINQLKGVVMTAARKMTFLPEFEKIARANFANDTGREEELYPFFYEILRSELDCACKGLGYGKVQGIKKEVDCLIYFDDGKPPVGIELAGPSKDSSYIKSKLKGDSEKIQELTGRGALRYGFVVTIFLKNADADALDGDIEIMVNGINLSIRVKSVVGICCRSLLSCGRSN